MIDVLRFVRCRRRDVEGRLFEVVVVTASSDGPKCDALARMGLDCVHENVEQGLALRPRSRGTTFLRSRANARHVQLAERNDQGALVIIVNSN
jgi:hypothetical protein